MKARQILIDVGKGSDAGPPEELATCSLMDIKRRLDKAMASCSRESDMLPAGIKVKVVTHLKNGGIMMELVSEEAVTWFQDMGVREKFLEKFYPKARIKSRDYHVVTQFIPLTFQPDRVADILEVEEINGMDKACCKTGASPNLWACHFHVSNSPSHK